MSTETERGVLEPAREKEAPHFVSTHRRPLLLVLAALLLAAGQYVFSRAWDDTLPLGAFAGPLEPVFREPESALAAIVLLLAGGAVFAFAWHGDGPVAKKALEEDDDAPVPGVVEDRVTQVFFGAAAFFFLLLALLLLSGRYERWYVSLFFAVFILLGIACLRQDQLRGVRWRLAVDPTEAAVVAAIMLGFTALNARDLDNWYFSAIGDEYAFFNLARDIANGFDVNLFGAEEGVYRQHVVASSAYQALFLKVLGPSNFNWKLAGLVSIVAALPLFYLLVRELFDRTVAVVATVMMASSHYLFAFVHIGYFNILPIFPTVAAFACFILGVRRGSSLLMLLAGCFAGMGFYTFFSARAAIVVMALWFLTLPRWNRRWGTSLPVSAGFIASVVPLFAVSKLYVIEEMLRQSAISYDESIVGASRWQRILENLPRNTAGFNYNDSALHYVSGSLADPITAALFIGGAVFAFSRLGDWRYRFLGLWLVLAFVASGVFSPYPQVPISRLLYLVPVVVIFASLALVGLLRGISMPAPVAYRLPAVAVGAYLVLAVALVLNIDRFWSETPSKIPTTMESVAVRAVLSDACSEGEGLRFVIGEKPEPLFKPAIDSYRLGSKAPVLVQWDNLQAPVSARGADVVCAVIMGPEEDRERIEGVLLTAWPDKSVATVTDHSGNVEVTLLFSSGQHALDRGR